MLFGILLEPGEPVGAFGLQLIEAPVGVGLNFCAAPFELRNLPTGVAKFGLKPRLDDGPYDEDGDYGGEESASQKSKQNFHSTDNFYKYTQILAGFLSFCSIFAMRIHRQSGIKCAWYHYKNKKQ